MKMLRFLSVPVLSLALAMPAFADKLPLSEVSDYLNDLKTAEAKFTQINDDGSVSTGRVFIKRPGRVRFEYDPPEKAMVLASANTVAIFDGRSNQPPETYPLGRTPLSVILARNVDLARANMVVGHAYDGTATVVTAQDPEHPEYGSIEMVFTGDPVELRQWVINDNSGGRTTVILGEMHTGMSLKNSLFNIDLHLPHNN
ncbi:outer membrane lipoprotein carrier protein LolA [Shimia sp. CNT1-13L.2]|jgi:outer membrane lipoprotein-sorting protein|uniref:LolA family protein n=1 Tax=Roseobacteraceae TaxID=2854170 RepID=UPI0020CBACB7|nr:outer membrane lipoprotein carrier protein LolA [Shimia sp. CNT1-13L.2]MCP9480904.1 outer membrane lipoprotein carrier protein LolA [Shimia sp. CNT1-13L.2]